MLVKAELEKLGLRYSIVELGEAEITDRATPEQLKQLEYDLRKSGLELMDDKKSKLIEKIKNIIDAV